MRLGHYTFNEPIKISTDYINYLIVENPAYLTQYIQELIVQTDGEEGKFTLSKNWEEVPIRNNVKIVINPFNINPNERKNLNRLISQLTSIALDEKYYQKTMNISTGIQALVQELVINSDALASCMNDFTVSDLFKVMDVKFDVSSESLLESICDSMTIFRDYGDISLFMFVNLRLFLSDEDVSDLRKFIAYNKIPVVLIEGRIYDFEPGERVKIIDSDLCEINFHINLNRSTKSI